MKDNAKYLALTGGVGGAKLALGLSKLLPPAQLAFVVNTGDDFEHMGLHISPDVDTLIYTLAGESNPDTGWGRRDESWHFMAALAELGGEAWFNLGDRDLALHVERTRRLAAGEPLTAVVAALADRFAVRHSILPMSDEPVRTIVSTHDGDLPFQHYFVRERCEPAVTGFRFAGSETAALNPAIVQWLDDPALAAVIICPSNPFVSVDPILAVGNLRDRLAAHGVPIVAVSPIVGGRALKGPAAKMMQELKIPATATAIAAHYRQLVTGLVLDTSDAALADAVAALGISPLVTVTLMHTLADRVSLARDVLAWCSPGGSPGV
jgi:LPPG:FO 2-phospho-L-lactate transferase